MHRRPAQGALQMPAPRRRAAPAWTSAGAAAVLFLGICGYARWTGHWRTDLPIRVYLDLIPHAQEFSETSAASFESIIG